METLCQGPENITEHRRAEGNPSGVGQRLPGGIKIGTVFEENCRFQAKKGLGQMFQAEGTGRAKALGHRHVGSPGGPGGARGSLGGLLRLEWAPWSFRGTRPVTLGKPVPLSRMLVQHLK